MCLKARVRSCLSLPPTVTLGCPWTLRGSPRGVLTCGALDYQSRKRLWEPFLPELDRDEDSGHEVPRPPDFPARRCHTSWVGAVARGRAKAVWMSKGGASRELDGGHREGPVVKGTGLQCPGADTGQKGLSWGSGVGRSRDEVATRAAETREKRET